MIRDIFPAALAISLALGAGVWSAERASSRAVASADLAAGSWYTLPRAGTNDANPYLKAHLARSGIVPLGSAEGLAFFATTDDSGEPLDAGCAYRIDGRIPAARLWTLHMEPGGSTDSASNGIHSRDVIYTAGGDVEIIVSRRAQPFNWLRQTASRNAPFRLSLTLYDTAVTGSTRLNQLVMPSITQIGCGNV